MVQSFHRNSGHHAFPPVLRIKPGRLEEAIQYLETEYGNDYLVKRSLELIDEGFFGFAESEIADSDRFGDIVLIPLKEVGLKDSSLGFLEPKLNHFKLVGMHGGLSYDEMIVPLIFRKIEKK